MRLEVTDIIVDLPGCQYQDQRMPRSEHLLNLLQVLRGYRRPVSGQALSEKLGVSIRTLYRDIASLQAQGAMIEGEPSVGYVMKPGFMLPPMMFRSEELDALVLGMRWVADRCDKTLSDSALSTLAKAASKPCKNKGLSRSVEIAVLQQSSRVMKSIRCSIALQ